MKFFKITSFILFICLIFIYGLGIGAYKWFPYDQLRSLKWFLTFDERGDSNYDENLKESLYIEKRNPEELLNLRKEVINLIVPSKEISVNFNGDKNKVEVSTKYYGITNNAVLTKNSQKSNCLRVYIQGHGGDPFNYSYHNKILNRTLERGCDILSMSMLGLGLNDGQASFPTNFGEIQLNTRQASEHGNYSFFYDEDNPHLDPLSLFLYPHMSIINETKNEYNYKEIVIMGISGGGWYSVWLSALMPEIKTTISYAGTLPFAFRKSNKNTGDWEQVYSRLYKIINYIDLYQLMIIDDDGKKNRQAFLVYNNDDPCCFSDPYATALKKSIDGDKSFPVVIVDKSDEHIMNESLIFSILN